MNPSSCVCLIEHQQFVRLLKVESRTTTKNKRLELSPNEFPCGERWLALQYYGLLINSIWIEPNSSCSNKTNLKSSN